MTSKLKVRWLLIFMVVAGITTGCSNESILNNPFETVSEEEDISDEPDTGITQMKKMLSGMYYVRHNGAYYPCKVEDASFSLKGDPVTIVDESRVIRYSVDGYTKIPTVYSKDKLIYYLDNEVMPEEIVWERYKDIGWSVGLSNIKVLQNGKLSLEINEDYISEKSSAKEVAGFLIDEVIVDTLDKKYLKEDDLDIGGVIKSLSENQAVNLHLYNGTIFNDYNLIADTHMFAAFEGFISDKYHFLENNLASIDIPEDLPTGYYFINNVGFFRYIKDSEIFDEKTDFNSVYITEENPYSDVKSFVDLRKNSASISTEQSLVSGEYNNGSTSITNNVYIPQSVKHIKIVVRYTNFEDGNAIPLGYFNSQPMSIDTDDGELIYEGASPGSGFHKLILSNMTGHDFTVEYTFK